MMAPGADTKSVVDVSTAQLVLFSVGNLMCGLDIRSVQEISSDTEITPVHHARSYVRGVINLRGQLLTVIDLRCKLGMRPLDLSAEMRIVVVRGQDGVVGLLVEQVDDVVAIDVETLEPPPGHIEQVPGAFFHAICKMDDRLAAVLDLSRVLEV